MKRVWVVLFSVSVLFLSAHRVQSKVLIRIHSPVEDELPRGLDIAGAKRGEWIDVVIEEQNLHDFAHLQTEVLIEDLESFYAARKGEYHSYPELVNHLETVAAVYSDIVMMDTLGLTYEGREILALKLSDNVTVDESEPEVLFIGLHHAREWPSLEICLFYVDTLTWSYGVDPHITEIVNSCEIWIVPCMNVDGYIWCHDLGHDWRKNMRYFPQFGDTGVDLNRNYDGANSGNPLGDWGSIPGGTSHSPHSEVYCGPSPFSEDETQAIRDLICAHDFVFAVSYHTYQESVMWPWGYSFDLAEDSDVMANVGEEMASRITKQSGVGTYDPYQSAGLYPTSGDFTDWGYGFSLYGGGKNLFAYTVEACASFHPSESSLDQVVRENFDGALYICEIADSIGDLLTPRVLPPEIAEFDSSYSDSYTILWSQKNSAASPDYYQLDELSGFSVATDDAESGSDHWDTRYFTVRDERSYSPGHAYCSNLVVGNEASTMTSVWPLIVSGQDSLRFWCWYDIEEEWDYAYAEVSLDGRQWQILGEFTGNSGGWVRKVYSLSLYEGSSLFLRFRYITDDYVEREGFWVDDIHPVPGFDSAVTLDSTITDTSYVASPAQGGYYYYRVRGHNDSRGWGDWSQLEGVLATSISEGECPSASPGVSLVECRINPFRSSTLIDFYVPDCCDISLDIYNLLGEHVTNLKRDKVEEGHHSAHWSSALAPGVYFCRLESPFGIRTIKLVRLR